MNIYVSRDSVCAADDCHAPNELRFYFRECGSVELLTARVCRECRLPQIAGGRATWCLSSIVPLLLAAQQWENPRALSGLPTNVDDLEIINDEICFHWTYFMQEDPEVVFFEFSINSI
jgi:hypothetical protein